MYIFSTLFVQIVLYMYHIVQVVVVVFFFVFVVM